MPWQHDRRRVYVLWINEDVMVDILNWRQHGHLCLPQLDAARDEKGQRVEIPADVEVLDAAHDWYRKQFGIRLAHHSFPPVPPGQQIPSLELTERTMVAIKLKNPEAPCGVPLELEHVRTGDMDITVTEPADTPVIQKCQPAGLAGYDPGAVAACMDCRCNYTYMPQDGKCVNCGKPLRPGKPIVTADKPIVTGGGVCGLCQRGDAMQRQPDVWRCPGCWRK